MTTRPRKATKEGMPTRRAPLPLTGSVSPHLSGKQLGDRVGGAVQGELGKVRRTSEATLQEYTHHASVPTLKLPPQRGTGTDRKST